MHKMLRFTLVLGLFFFSSTGFAQTNFDIIAFNTLNLDGNSTLEICPGSQHEMTFTLTAGQLNPFGQVLIKIRDKFNPVNPVNDSTIGVFDNGGSALVAGAIGSIPVNVTIPMPILSGDYIFYITTNPAAVQPPPAQSDTVERTVIPNPRSRIILDTASNRFDNIFKTDSSFYLQSYVPFIGPTPGGLAPIFQIPGVTPVGLDSTINICQGDSLFLWNPDSLTASEHIWLLNGSPLPLPNTNSGHVWVYQPGYYALATIRANACTDSAEFIGVGDPALGAFTLGNRGVYFHTYDVDTTLQRIGVGNLAGLPTRFCHGDSLIIQARQSSSHPLGSYVYHWVNSAGDTIGTNSNLVVKTDGDYSVFIRESIGNSFSCEVQSNIVSVKVDPLPASSIGTAPATLCYGDVFTLQDTNTYFPFNTYEWLLNGNSLLSLVGDTNFFEADTNLLQAFGVFSDSIATFHLRVIDTLGCDSLSLPVVFNFLRYPKIAFSTADTLGLCSGDSILVSAFTTNNVSSVFTWFSLPGNNVVSNTSNLNIKNNGTYYSQAVGPNNCTTYDTLFVFDLSVFADAGPDQVVDSGSVVQLAGSGGVSYYWYASSPVYFNNPFNPNAQTIPTQSTTTYYLEVTGANGCTDLDSMVVTWKPKVEDPLERFSDIQNIVTPNGDGINDGLDLSRITDGDNCELILINRWGAEVYRKNNYNSEWEGQDQGGDPLQDGTYYYILRCPGDDFRLKGAVTIIRSN